MGGDPKDAMVLAGVHDLDHLSSKANWATPDIHERIQVRGVKHYYVHPDYDKVSDEHDMAVIEMEDPLDFTDYVQPACLPTRVRFKFIENQIRKSD